MIPLLIGVFLFLLFLVTIILSAKTWRGWQIAIACVTFLAGMGLVVVAAMSTKTHVTWHKQLNNTEKQLATADKEHVELTYGDPQLVDDSALLHIQQHLKRVLLDRGRVWRRCTATPNGNTFVVSTVPPDTPEDQIKPNGIDPNMVLYAFLELRDEDLSSKAGEDVLVPAAYLGEFRVTQADARSATLEANPPVDGAQVQLMANRAATWTLYEMMPLDSHVAYSEQDVAGQILDDTNKPAFGTMDELKLRQTFALVSGLPPEDPQITEMIAAYVKDGSAATDQEVGSDPENIWQKLEFEKAHKERVDSNNLDQGLAGDYFDAEGYAEVPQLRQGEEASIRAKDIGLFPYGQDEDKRLVDGLVSSGVCRNLGPYFVRNLRDYEEAFHDIWERFQAITADKARAQRDIDALSTSIRDTQAQTAYRQEERAKLQTDRDKCNSVRDQLTTATDALAAEKQALQEELSKLYATNLALSRKLTTLNQTLTDEIDRRTAAAAELQ